MDLILAGVLSFLASIVPQILIFVALCLLDLGLGIAAAIRNRVFEWRRVADFYYSNVLAYLLGWFVFAAFGAFAIDKLPLLDQFKEIGTTGFVWGTWMFLVASLVGSIGGNFKLLYGKDLLPGVTSPEKQ